MTKEFRVDLMEGPDKGDWEFRVVETHPEAYRELHFITIPQDVAPDAELILEKAWDSLNAPEDAASIRLCKSLRKMFKIESGKKVK